MASDGSNKYLAKMSKALLKDVSRRINTREAEQHLQAKFSQWGWDQGGEKRLIHRMQQIPNKITSTTIRIHSLKMILYQKVKDYCKEMLETKRGLNLEWSRSNVCASQEEEGTACEGHLKYTNGIFGRACCQAHDPTAAGTLADDEVCGFCRWTPTQDRHIQADPQVAARKCNLCGKGEATWAHWIDYRPVFQVTFAKLGMLKSSDTVDSTDDKVEFALACHIIAAMKFFIHEQGGLHEGSGEVRTQTQQLDAFLKPLRNNLPPELLSPERLGLLRFSGRTGNTCHKTDTTRVIPAKLEQGRLEAEPMEPKLVSAVDLDRNDVIAQYTKSEMDNVIETEEGWAMPLPENGAAPNCRYVNKKCICGAFLKTLIANRPISKGEPLITCTTPQDVEQPYSIIVRFDGSCKAPNPTNPRAGAGIAIFITDAGGEVIGVSRLAWPLPWARNAQVAEVFGSKMALHFAAEEEARRGEGLTVVIQGDNYNVIRYWQGKRKALQEGLYKVLHRNIGEWQADMSIEVGRYEFLHRKFNGAADQAAVVGANIMKKYDPSIEPNIDEVIDLGTDTDPETPTWDDDVAIIDRAMQEGGGNGAARLPEMTSLLG